jgi:hypothetical protein
MRKQEESMWEHGNILSNPNGQNPYKYRNSVTSMLENGIMVNGMAWAPAITTLA